MVGVKADGREPISLPAQHYNILERCRNPDVVLTWESQDWCSEMTFLLVRNYKTYKEGWFMGPNMSDSQ
jgi:hypothetical protein